MRRVLGAALTRGLLLTLILLILLSVSSAVVYVGRGSDISLCNMKCAEPLGALELYRTCGGKDDTLLEYFCQLLYTKNHYTHRLHLDTGSGCWTLTHVGKSDSCVYKTYYYGRSESLLSTTDVHVLDPVLITSITSNSSWLGEDVAVSVHYSGEESAVTWELEGKRLPERYRLMDDNMTLIIPIVRREDAQSRFRVRVTNPVSEETRDYRLINDSNYLRLLEEEATGLFQKQSSQGGVGLGVGVAVVAVAAVLVGVIYVLYQNLHKKKKSKDEQKDAKRNDEPLCDDAPILNLSVLNP